MLFYTGVTILHLSEKAFWRSTPVKLTELSNAHMKANTPSNYRTVDYVDEAGIDI